MSTSPAAAPRNTGRARFVKLIEETVPQIDEVRGTRAYALDFGIDEQALDDYVAGACSAYERKAVEHVLVRNRWAMNYVVSRVKEKRKQR